MEENKLKPVNCGCGGEAKVLHAITQSLVWCSGCGLESRMYDSEDNAVRAWNLAMGAERCCNTCESFERGCYCMLWSIFCPSDHWCKDWSMNDNR